uniref:Proline-rich protein n=1 Tax=Argas monolakensis TaxID=34602 RepID=Q09JY4_ARGMO|nr:Proline-rich protein [Argas monolakensis]
MIFPLIFVFVAVASLRTEAAVLSNGNPIAVAVQPGQMAVQLGNRPMNNGLLQPQQPQQPPPRVVNPVNQPPPNPRLSIW